MASSEACRFCAGTGERTANENFLLARLQHPNWRWTGMSSNAMIVAAISGEKPKARPYDGADLGRCMITRDVAPLELRPAMDRMIRNWIRVLRKESPGYVDGARVMRKKEGPRVRTMLKRET